MGKRLVTQRRKGSREPSGSECVYSLITSAQIVGLRQ